MPCKGRECSGKEVMDTGCDDGDATQKLASQSREAIKEQPVTVAGVSGALSLRYPDPSYVACRGLFWMRFIPDPSNKLPFEVWVQVDGQPSQVQPSLEGNPAETLISVVLYADLKHRVTACVKATTPPAKEFCFPEIHRVF